MQNLRQQNGPTVTATPQVKPVTHGDSGTLSQSSSLPHSPVHMPLFGDSGRNPTGVSLALATGIFKQVRVGEQAKPFKMLKFRTMFTGADPALHQEPAEVRLMIAHPPPWRGEPEVEKLDCSSLR